MTQIKKWNISQITLLLFTAVVFFALALVSQDVHAADTDGSQRLAGGEEPPIANPLPPWPSPKPGPPGPKPRTGGEEPPIANPLPPWPSPKPGPPGPKPRGR